MATQPGGNKQLGQVKATRHGGIDFDFGAKIYSL